MSDASSDPPAHAPVPPVAEHEGAPSGSASATDSAATSAELVDSEAVTEGPPPGPDTACHSEADNAAAAPTEQHETIGPGTHDAAAASESGDTTIAPAASAATEPAEAERSKPDEDVLRLAEAMVFSAAGPVSPRALVQVLPESADADAVIAALRARYAGRGVELVDAAGGVMFRTAPDLAPRLRKVVEVPRKLPRVAMETLAIIAYHQPCTRPEIEEIRGTSLSQQTLDALLEANLVAPKGRREVPGRPTLWGTTPQFLAQFGLKDLRDLPQRGDLLLEPPKPAGVSGEPPLTTELSGPPPSAAAPDEASPQPGQETASNATPDAEATAPPAPRPTAPGAESPVASPSEASSTGEDAAPDAAPLSRE